MRSFGGLHSFYSVSQTLKSCTRWLKKECAVGCARNPIATFDNFDNFDNFATEYVALCVNTVPGDSNPCCQSEFDNKSAISA